MALGLGASLSTVRNVSTPPIVTDGLVLKQNFDTGAVTPISDGAAYFDGTDDYITMGDSADMGTGDVSASCWFRPLTSAVHGATLIGKQANYNVNSVGYGLYYRHSTATVWWNIGDGSAGDRLNEAIADIGVSEGQWIHTAGTYDQSTGVIKLYLNGVQVDTATESSLGTLNNALDLKIGHGSAYYKGNICNVGIWSAVLTAAQIKSIMYKDYSGLTTSEKTNLVSWWNLSALHADGSTVVDSHGSNNGTLS